MARRLLFELSSLSRRNADVAYPRHMFSPFMKKPKITFEISLNEDVTGNWSLVLTRLEAGHPQECYCLFIDQPLIHLREDADRLLKTLGKSASCREVVFEERRERLLSCAQRNVADYEAAYLAAATDSRRDQCAVLVNFYLKELNALRNWARTPLAKAA